jgi:hypothetical protein
MKWIGYYIVPATAKRVQGGTVEEFIEPTVAATTEVEAADFDAALAAITANDPPDEGQILALHRVN